MFKIYLNQCKKGKKTSFWILVKKVHINVKVEAPVRPYINALILFVSVTKINDVLISYFSFFGADGEILFELGVEYTPINMISIHVFQ